MPGRWGQREAGFNNGPAGPNTKTVWTDPFTWMDGTRSGSPTVPAGALVGPSVATAFCGAVAQVTGFLNLAAQTSLGAIGIATGLLLLILVPAALTRWRPTAIEPMRQARALGQLLVTSVRLYWRHALTFLLIALATLAILGAVNGIEPRHDLLAARLARLLLISRSHRPGHRLGDRAGLRGASVGRVLGHDLDRQLARLVGDPVGDNWMTRRRRGRSLSSTPSYLSSIWLDGGSCVCSRQTSFAWFDYASLLLLGRTGSLEENAPTATKGHSRFGRDPRIG